MSKMQLIKKVKKALSRSKPPPSITGPLVGLQETSHNRPLYPIAWPNEEGYLKVSELHSLFYAVYGNPQGIPVVILHGGPGAGCDDFHTCFFDLERWFVIMFDQRGALRSNPIGCMEENTSQLLVEDIETLRKKLGIDQWVVFGGSWGSVLATLYGQTHPDRCLGFILRGVFLGRPQDAQHLFSGLGKVYPEAYEAFVQHIPEKERHDLMGAYRKRVMDPDPTIHLPAMRASIRFTSTCSTHFPNPAAVEKSLENDALILSMTKAFHHYAHHDFFLRPNQLLADMERVSHLPALIVQGRWDAICLPEMAYLLHAKWKNSGLWIEIHGGHSYKDPSIASALAAATDRLIEQLI